MNKTLQRVEIRRRTTETGTSYDIEHDSRTYRLRIYNDGRVHLWINGAHYRVKTVGHETVKSFSTNVVLAPIEHPTAAVPTTALTGSTSRRLNT